MVQGVKLLRFYCICIVLALWSHAFSEGKIGIVVNKDLYSSISQSLDTYIKDLKQIEGKDVWLEKDKYSATNTTKEMKDGIKKQYDESKLEGVILIGDLPIQRFKIPDDESGDTKDFPCDLFYMDLDGAWTGSGSILTSHTGQTAPEIWVSRITASVLEKYLGDEAEAIKKYFAKVYNRMNGKDPMERRYVIAGQKNYWPDFEKENLGDLDYGKDKTTIIEGEKCGQQWKEAIVKGQEYGFVYSHSSESEHQIGFTIQDLANSNANVRFFNCFACSNGNYSKANMGGLYALSNAGLVSLSSTKTGSMRPETFTYYNKPLAEGKSIGNALKDYFLKCVEYKSWIYGLTLQGVGTLKIRPYGPTAISNTSSNNENLQHQLLISPNPVYQGCEKITFTIVNRDVGFIGLDIYDALGGCVFKESINPAAKSANTWDTSFSWDLKTLSGKKVSAGTYMVVLKLRKKNGTHESLKAMVGVKENLQ